MTKYFPRKLTQKLVPLLKRKEIFVILGPRQGGKTTLFLILQKYLREKKGVKPEQIFSFTFEDPETTEQFNLNPREFVARRIEGLPKRAYFFFDEYHWVKDGGRKLKLLFDLFAPKVKFLVTGSSSLELTFKTGKYLVGRAFFFYLYPFSFEEFLQTKEKEVFAAYQETRSILKQGKLPAKPTIFNKKIAEYFKEFLVWGGYPEVVKTKRKEEKKLILKSIVNTYLEKEIRSLLLVEDLEGYRRLLKILASQIGQLINYQQIVSDSSLNFRLVKKYLSFLEETYIVKRVPPFHRNLSSELRKAPKIYFLDNGLRQALLQEYSGLPLGAEKGKLAENFVFSQILKEEDSTHFWRTKGGAEVDFILEKRGRIIPLEVKFQQFLKPTLSQGFFSFINRYNPKQGVVLTKNFWGKRKIGSTQIIFYPIWYW